MMANNFCTQHNFRLDHFLISIFTSKNVEKSGDF